MTTPVLDLNPARLEKSVIQLPLGDAGALAEIPIYKDRATGKVVAINLNSFACIATGISLEGIKPRLTEFFNKHVELKQV